MIFIKENFCPAVATERNYMWAAVRKMVLELNCNSFAGKLKKCTDLQLFCLNKFRVKWVCVYIYIHTYIYMCIYICIYIYIHIYIYIYICVCVCVCVCVYKTYITNNWRVLLPSLSEWVKVSQSSLTLFEPLDCSPSGSSVHGILQARILEWVAIPFSRGSS